MIKNIDVAFSNHWAAASVGTTLSDAGLMTDGSELWFSIKVRTGSDIATNGDFGFALGSARISSGNNIPIQGLGEQKALGFTFKNNQLRASEWTRTVLNATSLFRSGTNSGNGASPNTEYMVAGRFIWGAASDTLQIYYVSNSVIFTQVSTLSGDFDQSLFNVISVGTKAASPNHWVDEIRFGASRFAVIPEPSTGLLVGFGFLLTFFRRKR